MITILLTTGAAIVVGLLVGFIPAFRAKFEEQKEKRRDPDKLITEARTRLGADARIFAVPGSDRELGTYEARLVEMLWAETDTQRSLPGAAARLREFASKMDQEIVMGISKDLRKEAAASDNLDVTVALIAVADRLGYDENDDF